MRSGRSVARRARGRTSAVIAATLLGSLLPTLPMAAAAAAGYQKPSAVSPEKPVKGSDARTKDRKADTTVSKTDGRKGLLPGKGGATLDLPGERGRAVKAGALPVALTSSGTAAKGARVELLGQDAAAKAGVNGLLFTVAGAGDGTGVSVDYSAFTQAAGSGFGSRLKLVRLPDCALTTPELAECRTQTPLPGGNDTEAQTVSAEALTAAPAGSTRIQAAGGAAVLAATAGPAGPGGDYKATPLSSASSWSTSLNNGSFTWSYSMPLSSMPGGLTPSIGLSYNSGSVDGRTSNSNNQSAWAGDGFDISPGFVERSYKPCADDGAPKSNGYSPGDQCWGTDNATISFAGHSGELIPVSADEWRIKNDDATKVVRVRDGARGNGDNDGEYFKATTPDGTTYHFGYNRLPNWTSGQPETKSVYTVPVFGNNAGEPCNGANFAASWCQQGWRWNLDLVVDAHGNDITYWYAPETNNYSRNLNPANRTPYVRGGHLDHIEYGQQKTDLYSATVKPTGRVDFATAERCLETTAGVCDAAAIDTNHQYWYDTPWDQICKDGTDCTAQFSPTFFGRTRLTQVVAKTLQANGAYAPMDTWDLAYKWGTADFDYQLLLSTIKHTGSSATPAIPLPPTALAYKAMVNRLDRTGDGRMPFVKQRLGTVTDEYGGQIDVNYSAEACDWAALPTPQSNTTRCFPQMYQAADTDPVTTEWFNKYVVESVLGTDRTGGAPTMVTRYTYLGDAAWHFDDEDGLTKEKFKTWSQWRGYAHARVQTGGVDGMATQADHWFLRGMDGDRSSPTDKNAKRAVTVDDGEGTTLTDDQAWAGVEYRVEQYDKPGGVVIGKTVNTPWKKQTAVRVRDWGTTTANMSGVSTSRAFTSLDKGAGASWRETRTTTVFDDYSRPVAVDSFGDVSTGADDKCTRTTYADNTALWILSGTIRTETVAANCAATVNRDTQADDTSAVLSDTRYRYDGQAYGAAPVKGDATLTQLLKTRTGNSATYLDNAATFDKYGRTLTSTEAASSTVYDLSGTTATTTASGTALTTTTAYQPATGRPVKVTITSPPAKAGVSSTAAVSSTTYDQLRGLPTSSSDANSRRTDVSYDALGRTLKVWLPNRSKADGELPNQEYGYSVADGQISAVADKTLNEDGSQQTSYTLYDGFGRTRQTQSPGDSGGRILTDTFYDARGQAALSYAAYYATGAPSATLRNVDDTTGVETQVKQEFDGLGRVVKSTALAGNGVGTPLATTLTEYGGDRVTVTPPAGGTPTTTLTDALGQTTELRQYKSATPTGAYDSTTYGYDAKGYLNRLTGPSGTTWTWLHDRFGRLTKAVDPDSGTTLSTYNDRGELVTSTSARGQTVANLYDNLSRLVETRDGSPTGPLLTSQTWDPTGEKGALASSSRYVTVGAKTWEYKTTYAVFDSLGRPNSTTVTVPAVPGQEALAGDYVSTVGYRLDGQPQSVTYPKAGSLPGEAVVFGYDGLHRPTTIEGLTKYQTGQTYSLTGKPLQATFSNGTADKQVYVTNSYEWGTQRLASSRTDRYGVATPVRAAAYTYDQAGNVTSVTDTSAAGTDRQCFGYDYLARLTQAYTPNTGSCTAPSGTQLGGPAPYWTSWTYNTNGTRATETRHNTSGNTAQDATTTYTYPANRPHALTSTSTTTGALGTPVVESYGYDASGNTTTRTLKPSGNQTSDQTLTWNTEGKLSQLAATVKTTTGSTTTTTTQTTDYLYDADGSRLIGHTLDTANPAAENWTLYLGATELKLTKGAGTATATRYYSLGDATAVRTDDNRLTFQTADHHGTAETDIDATTGTVQQRRTLPFGATRGTTPTGWSGTRGFLGGTDEPTGLTHLGARDYDPATGRFTSVDPLLVTEDPQSLAAYTYANNNPLTISDPTGLYGPYCVTQSCVDATGGSGTPATHDPGAKKDGNGLIPPAPSPTGTTGSTYSTTYVQISSTVFVEDNGNGLTDQLAKWYKDLVLSDPNGGWTQFNVAPQWDVKQYWYKLCENPDAHCSKQLMEALGANQVMNSWVQEGVISGGASFLFVRSCAFYDGGCGLATAAISYSLEEGPSPFGGENASVPGSLITSGSTGTTLFTFPGCANSFPAGTQVLMADGSTKSIDQLEIGDLVVATDPEGRITDSAEVDATISTADDSEFTDLTIDAAPDGSATITSTAHHPYWDATTGHWVLATDLEPGEQLLTADGRTVTITTASTEQRTPQTAYNLTIRGIHTYYVLAGGTPVLVHNACGDTTHAASCYCNWGEEVILRPIPPKEAQQTGHSLQRMDGREVSDEQIQKTLQRESFPYYHEGQWKVGHFDPTTGTFVGKTIDGNINTVIVTNQAYVDRLKKVKP
ncbi:MULTISPECIES: polymorphic toxin-type HINT domain-containing protein [Kitasatospora]|nr:MULTISPECIES: polymorphic toxin-type HINT domain-containing protein [Kitasatospora]